MAVFLTTIVKAINGYKAMLRKNLTASEYAEKLDVIGFKQSYLKAGNEAKLYEIATQIVLELERELTQVVRERSVNFYYGEEQLLQHLKKLLGNYKLEDGKVVNFGQQSSCALLTIIQLLEGSDGKLTDELTQKLCGFTQVIANYGTKDQKTMLKKVITNSKFGDARLFFRQLLTLVACAD